MTPTELRDEGGSLVCGLFRGREGGFEKGTERFGQNSGLGAPSDIVLVPSVVGAGRTRTTTV